MGRAEARRLMVDAIDARHRPEMREMEKVLVLQILDSSWMEHLRAMDHPQLDRAAERADRPEGRG